MIAETLLLSAAGGVVSAMASYATKTAIEQVDPATIADLEKTSLKAERQEQQKTEANIENSGLTAKSPKTSNPDDDTQLDQAKNSSLTKKEELTFAEKVKAGRGNSLSTTGNLR